MKSKYSVATRLLVVLASAITGFSIGLLFYGQFRNFITWLCVALIIFGIAVVLAYKKNKPEIMKKFQAVQDATNENLNMDDKEKESNSEDYVDETEFEEKEIETEPVYTEIKAPEDDDDKDVVDEFH